MLYPKNQTSKLDKELFKTPTSEYRCTPFWAWNCDLKEEELLKEIEYMKEMGMGGFHMHTRVGMSTEYLSDAYMSMIKACTDKAKKEEMLAWLYDEDKWPSGFAGGYVTKKKENRQKYLLLTTEPYQEGAALGTTLDSSGRASRANNGYLVAKYDVKLDEEGYLSSYRRIGEEEAAEGTAWYAYLETQGENPWFNFQTYVDTLSKSAIDDFINITHERYKEIVGEDFGKAVPAIFTDEPQVSRKSCLDFAKGNKEVVLPFTTDYDETYRAAYGESILDKLPEVLWEMKDKAPTTRYRYHDHTTERFAEAFCDNIGAWCRKNGIMLTGHMMEEPTLESQTCAIGEAMRHYRGFDLPGIDMLCDHREYTTAKQAASAAHQFGYCGVMSELYGVTNWDFDFRGHKLQGDWQAALGVSVRVPHLYWVSMGGEAKRDYPASIGHQSAWYKEYSYIEDHFARVNTAMTRGKADVKIGVIHPIESYWIHYGPNDQTSGVRDEMDRNFKQITDWLIRSTLDFDFISESLLANQFKETEKGFGVGEMSYDVVLIPSCETLRATTLAALKVFAAKGGKVIFMGNVATMVDAAYSDAVELFADSCEQIGWNKTDLLHALEPYRMIGIRYAAGLAGETGKNEKAGKMSEGLMYGMRADGDGKNLFICHCDNSFRGTVDPMENYAITIKGEYAPTVFDTMTGEIYPIAADYVNGDTVIRWDCYAQSSLLLRLEPGRSTASATLVLENGGKMSYLSCEMEAILSEPNVLVLDMAKWKLDDGVWQEKEEMLRICNKAKESLGLSTAATHGAQPWVVEKTEPKNTISLEITFNSDVEVEDAMLALENFDITDICFNGKAVEKIACGTYVDWSITKVKIGKIEKGENTIVLTKPFNVVSCIENIFVLGDFGTEVIGDMAKITAPVRKLRFGDFTTQGLAFYGGLVTYRMKIAGGAKTKLALGLFAAPCVTVELDGKRVGNVSLAPYMADLGDLSEGEHTLDITVHGSRVNTFGALHNSNYAVTWFGPDAWHSTDEKWSYEYRITKSGLLTAPRLIRE